MSATLRQKVSGMLLGVGIGDALGMPLECFTAEKIASRWGRVTDYMAMATDHTWHHDLAAGGTTDDTQLTLAVARALINCNGTFDMDEIVRQHVIELDRGSKTWGPSTRNAVLRLKEGVHWSDSGKTDKPNTGMGNGVVMKISPLAACELSSVRIQEYDLAYITEMTHRTNEALFATFVHFAVLRHLLNAGPETFDGWPFLMVIGSAHNAAYFYQYGEGTPVSKEETLRLAESYQNLAFYEPPATEMITTVWPNTFLAPDTLGLSYAFFLRKPDSIEALYDTVNAGGDTDSTGSIVASMLGALHGPDIFPTHLLRGLLNREEILQTADQLCDVLGIS